MGLGLLDSGTLVILALVVAAIVWIVGELSDRRGREAASGVSAREILDRRLASGEITDEQHEQLHRSIEAPAHPVRAATRTSRRGARLNRRAPRRAYISCAGERRGVAEHRQTLLAGLSGRVIEVGAGNGLNFAYYPAAVTQVVARS